MPRAGRNCQLATVYAFSTYSRPHIGVIIQKLYYLKRSAKLPGRGVSQCREGPVFVSSGEFSLVFWDVVLVARLVCRAVPSAWRESSQAWVWRWGQICWVGTGWIRVLIHRNRLHVASRVLVSAALRRAHIFTWWVHHHRRSPIGRWWVESKAVASLLSGVGKRPTPGG